MQTKRYDLAKMFIMLYMYSQIYTYTYVQTLLNTLYQLETGNNLRTLRALVDQIYVG